MTQEPITGTFNDDNTNKDNSTQAGPLGYGWNHDHHVTVASKTTPDDLAEIERAIKSGLSRFGIDTAITTRRNPGGAFGLGKGDYDLTIGVNNITVLPADSENAYAERTNPAKKQEARIEWEATDPTLVHRKSLHGAFVPHANLDEVVKTGGAKDFISQKISDICADLQRNIGVSVSVQRPVNGHDSTIDLC